MISRDVEASLRIEHLPTEDLKDMAVLIGMDAVIKLLKKFEGRSVYFPKNWTKEFRRNWVSQHWNGENAHELGKDLGVSTTTIYRVVNDKRVNGPLITPRARADVKQTSLFGREIP